MLRDRPPEADAQLVPQQDLTMIVSMRDEAVIDRRQDFYDEEFMIMNSISFVTYYRRLI